MQAGRSSHYSNLELGGGWLGVPHHPKNGNVGGEDDDEFLILSYPILLGTPKWYVEYWKFSKISLLASRLEFKFVFKSLLRV